MFDPYLLTWWLNEIAQPIVIIVGILVWLSRLVRGGR